MIVSVWVILNFIIGLLIRGQLEETNFCKTFCNVFFNTKYETKLNVFIINISLGAVNIEDIFLYKMDLFSDFICGIVFNH